MSNDEHELDLRPFNKLSEQNLEALAPGFKRDAHYEQALSENGVLHYYGPHFFLESNAYTLHLAALLGADVTKPPQLFHYLEKAYHYLLTSMLEKVFPKEMLFMHSRMKAQSNQGTYYGPGLKSNQSVVLVNVARAGMVPSQYCYEFLCDFVAPEFLRQDHLFMNRKTNKEGEVIGCDLHGSKTGSSIEGAVVIIADPMGATGETILSVVDFYQQKKMGKPLMIIALHLMVTPEYLLNVEKKSKESVFVFALRLDRGLSTKAALESQPGELITQEKGLTEKHYIIPGAGGMGELLNNCKE